MSGRNRNRENSPRLCDNHYRGSNNYNAHHSRTRYREFSNRDMEDLRTMIHRERKDRGYDYNYRHQEFRRPFRGGTYRPQHTQYQRRYPHPNPSYRPHYSPPNTFRNPVTKASNASSRSDDSRDEIIHYKWHSGELMNNGKYKILNLLGDGTFGRVLLGERTQDQAKVAIKVVRNVKRYIDSGELEYEINQKLLKLSGASGSLTNCVIALDKFYHGEYLCLVFETLGQSLLDVLEGNDYHPFPMNYILQIAKDCFRALSFLHACSCTHTDIKLENILFKDSTVTTLVGDCVYPASPHVTFIDFGGATFSEDYHSTIVNTRQYRSPEIILMQTWDEKSDIWSMGCVLMELYLGELLFSTHDDFEHLFLILQTIGEETFPACVYQKEIVRCPALGMKKITPEQVDRLERIEKDRRKRRELEDREREDRVRGERDYRDRTEGGEREKRDREEMRWRDGREVHKEASWRNDSSNYTHQEFIGTDHCSPNNRKRSFEGLDAALAAQEHLSSYIGRQDANPPEFREQEKQAQKRGYVTREDRPTRWGDIKSSKLDDVNESWPVKGSKERWRGDQHLNERREEYAKDTRREKRSEEERRIRDRRRDDSSSSRGSDFDRIEHLNVMKTLGRHFFQVRRKDRWEDFTTMDNEKLSSKSKRKILQSKTLQELISNPRHQMFLDFVSKLLVLDPSRRLSANEALQHPFLLMEHYSNER